MARAQMISDMEMLVEGLTKESFLEEVEKQYAS
jgi:ABC-type microcin C transport system permease subunit YejB